MDILSIGCKYNSPRKAEAGVFAAIWHPNTNSIVMQVRTALKPKELLGIKEFPGGGLEENEDCWIGLCREVKEELGLDLSDQSLFIPSSSARIWLDQKKNPEWIRLTVVRANTKELKFAPQDDEAKDPQWIPVSEINKEYLSPAFRFNILPVLRSRLLDPPL